MITAKQMKAARMLVEWGQKDLSAASGLSLPTIQRMETLGPERSYAGNVAGVQAALEAAGVVFIDADDGGPGVRLRKGKP